MEKLNGLLTERGDWRGHAGREKVEEETGERAEGAEPVRS